MRAFVSASEALQPLHALAVVRSIEHQLAGDDDAPALRNTGTGNLANGAIGNQDDPVIGCGTPVMYFWASCRR